MCQASILPTELQLPPFQHRFQCASPRTQSRQAVGQSQGHPQAHFLVHIARAQSVNGMPSRCALVPGTREGGFVPSKLNNKCSFLTSAGLYWSPAPSWREEPQVCQTEKQSYPIQPPCGALGQGNLAKSLPEIVETLGSQKPGQLKGGDGQGEKNTGGKWMGRNGHRGHS